MKTHMKNKTSKKKYSSSRRNNWSLERKGYSMGPLDYLSFLLIIFGVALIIYPIMQGNFSFLYLIIGVVFIFLGWRGVEEIMNKKWASILVVIIIFVVLVGFLINFIFYKKTSVNGPSFNKTKEDQRKMFDEFCLGRDFDCPKILINPQSNYLVVSKGQLASFGFLFRNTNDKNGNFSYQVKADSITNCGLKSDKIDLWVVSGGFGNNILINYNDIGSARVIVSIPNDSRSCIFRLNISVKENNEDYANDAIDIEVK